MGSSPRRLDPAARIQLRMTPDLCVIAEQGIFIGDGQELLRLDRISLQPIWRKKVEDLWPAFVRQSVLILGSSGDWYGADIATGRLLWGPKPYGYCKQWRDQAISVSPLAVVDARTGEIVRELGVKDEDIAGDTKLHGDVVVGGSTSRESSDPFIAVHLGEDRILWKRDLLQEATSRVQVRDPTRIVFEHDGFLLLGRTSRVFGCRMSDGSIQWDQKLVIPYQCPNVVGDQVFVLVNSVDEDAHFVCLDIVGGALVYDVPLPPVIKRSDVVFRGSVGNGQIVFPTRNGVLVSLRLNDGAVEWWFEYRIALGVPNFIDGRLIVPAYDGSLLVFEPPHL